MFYDPAKTAYFKEIVLQVTAQAFAAAGYERADNPLAEQRGLINFHKKFSSLGQNARTIVGWQLVAFEQSPLARFRIELSRQKTDENDIRQTLSHVIWHAYGARVLPSDDYWWEFRTGDELPFAIAAAGKMLFAYGIPWLEMREA